MRQISAVDVLLVWLISAISFVATVAHFRNYWQEIDQFADNGAYIGIATAIHKWNFVGLVVKQFWGVSYLTAALSLITRFSDKFCFVVLCWVSSLLSVWLAYRLWGGWTASLFSILNFDWLQRSYLGGSEALFVGLLFGTFLLIRKGKWELAASVAALSTVVRPLGVVCLLAMGVTLLAKKLYVRLAAAVLISSMIGLLYVIPLKLYLGDSLATVHSYHDVKRSLFGVPFQAIIEGTLRNHPPLTNLVLSYGWIFFIVAGCLHFLLSKSKADYRNGHLTEVLFVVGYLFAVACYNYPYWALGNFARFAIPIVPFAILGVYPWIPKSRALLYCAAVVFPVMAGASAIGIRNIFPALR